MTFPHCDQRILHEPRGTVANGTCTFCDKHSEWQELRVAWGINFTGQTDPDKLPCPADFARGDTHQNWPGNRPDGVVLPIMPSEEQINKAVTNLEILLES